MAVQQVRTVRFTEEDIKDIEAFLMANPVFDFSTLVRISIKDFIRNPKLEVRGIPQAPSKSHSREKARSRL